MPKNKRPVPRKPVTEPDDQEDAVIQNLLDLAIVLARPQSGKQKSIAGKNKQDDFNRIIRKCLLQKKDDILYEALDRLKEDSPRAYFFLKESIEEASEIVLVRREDKADLEINAFVIPLIAHIKGGLHQDQCFQDQEAFESLTRSFQDAQLESRDAQVVLVSHAYHPEEIDRISYSQLNAMVRDAFSAMTSKKAVTTPALDRSMSGWPEKQFAPDDLVVELRFLLGFSLKSMDDPFYQIPADEAAADAYFDTRAAHFQQWAQQYAPLVQRCLVTDGREADIHFLYQDLFHGGKETGMSEYGTLEMMAELHYGLQLHQTLPEDTQALIGPSDIGGEMVLRVNLLAKENQTLIASAEKPLPAVFDLDSEAADIYDALSTIGVSSMAVTSSFDAEGQPSDVTAFPGAKNS